MRVAWAAVVLGAALLAGPLPCAAQDAVEDGWRPETDARATIAAGEAPAERWWWTWLSIHLGLMAGQLTWAALTDDDGMRVDRLTGATSAALGAGFLLVFAPPAMSAPQDLEEDPEHPVEILRHCADRQRRSHSVLAHLLVVGWALISGSFLWLGFDRPLSGALQAGSVLLLGELRILTQPTHALDTVESW